MIDVVHAVGTLFSSVTNVLLFFTAITIFFGIMAGVYFMNLYEERPVSACDDHDHEDKKNEKDTDK